MAKQVLMQDHPGPSITVFHLVWAPFGTNHFSRFLDSYDAHPAGVAHRLHVLYNGFPSSDDVAPYEDIAANISHDATVVDSPKGRNIQDIRVYLDAAQAARTRYVCYLNSHAEILADDWLLKLYRPVRDGSAGIAGATGSYESRYTETLRVVQFSPYRLGFNLLRWPARLVQQRALRAWERSQIRDVQAHFLAFPNPHLRTNAFLLERDTMLSADPGPIVRKEDAYRFESGRHGLTRRILDSGGEAVVVGRDGRSYPVAEWEKGETFRTGNQANLLVADNQTRGYDKAPPERRAELAHTSWGA